MFYILYKFFNDINVYLIGLIIFSSKGNKKKFKKKKGNWWFKFLVFFFRLNFNIFGLK